MSTKVGVGKSQEPEAFEAGAEAAKKALAAAGVDKADLVLVTSTIGYDNEQLVAGVRSVSKDAPLAGGSTLGVISQEGPDETLRRVEVMAFSSDKIHFTPAVATGLKADSYAVGKALADQLNAAWPENPKAVLIMGDGLTMNSDQLFKALDDNLKTHLPFVGGTASETLANKQTFQYFGDKVTSDSAIAVLLSGDFDFDFGVSHGSMPLGVTKTVTKAEHNHIFEIDNKPAFEVFREFLGSDVNELNATVVNGIALGTKTPEGLSDAYEDYILRVPLVLDKTDNSMFMAAEWPSGTEISILRRDPDTIIRRSTEISSKLKERHAGQNPAFVLHFECVGRSKSLIGADVAKHDVEVNQAAFDKSTPWWGYYTYGEIAPIKDQNEFHNWTSVVFAVYD